MALLTAAVLVGCASGGEIPRISAAEANASLARGYLLSPGDLVRVTVFDEATLSGEYAVARDGTLAIPLLPPIDVKGRTEGELAQVIAQLLTEGGYLLDPKVSAAVMRYQPIYILGEVANPGEYAFTGDLTFLSAIAKAGGFTPRAKKGQVMLLRQIWPTGRLVDLSTTPLVIAPGDTIVVRESFL